MVRGRGLRICIVVLALLACAPAARAAVLDPAASQAVGTVSPRFLSFGFDISQLTERASGSPTDFTRARLIRLARALAPAYVRYSGTKIDETYYDDTGSLGVNPPAGYRYVLGRAEWEAANRFAQTAGLGVIVGINSGPGPRNPDFTWNAANARALLERAKTIGLPPSVVSFGNEPNLAVYGSGMPATYSAADYARDVDLFRGLRSELVPGSTFIGPGPFFTTGAERPIVNVPFGPDVSALMPLVGSRYDAVSYHQYPAFGDSAKCASLQPRPPADPLAADFLDRVGGALAYMSSLRDAHAPGKPLWVDEFGNTACGGVVGYSNTFAASFYYLNALGTMARGGVKVASRWTLAGPQPYALVDDATLTPRPDYWAALLWRRLMGTTVLKPALSGAPATLRTYASCTPGATRRRHDAAAQHRPHPTRERGRARPRGRARSHRRARLRAGRPQRPATRALPRGRAARARRRARDRREAVGACGVLRVRHAAARQGGRLRRPATAPERPRRRRLAARGRRTAARRHPCVLHA